MVQKKIIIIDDNNGLKDVKTDCYIRCPYGAIVMQDIHMKQGCGIECAAFDMSQELGNNQFVAICKAGNFTIGIVDGI